jgi:anti-sigma B factor antagonist
MLEKRKMAGCGFGRMPENKRRIMIFLEGNNTLRCVFSGRLDGTICSDIEGELRQRVADFVQGKEQPQLIFDLADVEYISSAFLRLCLVHCKMVGKSGFWLARISGDVYKVFHISGFTEFMQVVDS